MNESMNKSNVSIGLVNPKSPDNVGSVMRAAGNFQVDNVFYTGKRYPRALMRNPDLPDMHRKVSKGIPLTEVSCLIEDAVFNKTIVCVEFAENATSLTQFSHPENVLYVFGPEDGTINQSIIDQAHSVIYIPTIGCMNLAASVNVVLYDRLAKSAACFDNTADNNALIKQSRDINNNLKVFG